MSVLIIIVVIVVILLALFVGLIFKSSVNRDQKTNQSGKATKTGKKPVLDSKQSSKLANARREITKAQQLALNVHDDEIAQTAKEVLTKAEEIVNTMREQPDEIRRASQFFGYYLPTISAVLNKYAELEKSGTDIAQQKETTKAYFADISKAFDAAYVDMFKDEKMNLEVETEAMQMALKRDGLL